MRGAVPPAAWAFAILVASDMLFLRRSPGSFAPFAFSQCESNSWPGKVLERFNSSRMAVLAQVYQHTL